jgi:hypothetical protein
MKDIRIGLIQVIGVAAPAPLIEVRCIRRNTLMDIKTDRKHVTPPKFWDKGLLQYPSESPRLVT